MTHRERVLALKLLKKQKRDPVYAKTLGIDVKIKKKEKTK